MPHTPNPQDPLLVSNNFFHTAAIDRKMDVGKIKQWLARGACPNTDDGEGWTVLHLFAQHGNTDGVKALLAAGAKPNLVGRSGLTALHVAQNGEIVELLNAAGANVNAEGMIGSTPLHTAVEDHYHAANQNRADIISTILALIAAGANVNAIGQYTAGRTPLDLTDRIDDPDLRDQARAVLTAAGALSGRDLRCAGNALSSHQRTGR